MILTDVECISRNGSRINSQAAISDYLFAWLKRVQTVYLAIVLYFSYCLDFGLDRLTHYVLATLILVAVIIGNEFVYFVKSFAPVKSLKLPAKKTKSDKSESSVLKLNRMSVGLESCNFSISKARIVKPGEAFVDFTGFTPAPVWTNKSIPLVVFCIDICSSTNGWSIWRSMSQIEYFASEVATLSQTMHGLSSVELRDGDDSSIDQFIGSSQLAVIAWLHALARCPAVAVNPTVRAFFAMPPYQKVDVLESSDAVSKASTQAISKFDKGRFWEGTSYDDVVFLDETEARKNLYIDCSYSHNFKIRGLTYMTDKRKVDAGSPICKMIMLEVIEASADDGGRIDHICSKGIVQERVKVLNNLPGNPFVLVLNIQIPGDPPVSIVSYFIVPPDLHQKMTSPEDVKFLKMLDKFFDMPKTEAERLAAWGINETDAVSVDPVVKSETRSVLSNRSNGSGQDTDNSGIGCNTDDEAEGKGIGRMPSNDEDEHGSTGAEAADLQDPEGATHHSKFGLSSSSFRKSLNLKMPSMRKLMQKKDEEELSTPKSKSRPTSLTRNISERLSNDRGEDGGGEEPKKKSNLLSRSLSKISAIGGMKKKKAEGDDADYSSENASETVKRVSALPAGDSEKLHGDSKPTTRSNSEADTQSLHSSVRSASIHSANSVELNSVTSSGTAAKSTLSTIAKKQTNPKGPMGLPSDITWPSPEEPGALPMDDYRNQRFKLIPVIIDGPWVVKMAVRSTPVLLGQKVVQRYFRGDKYMEIDVHVGSSIIAAQIVGVCRSYTKMFSTNLGIVIQGDSEDELPERLVACITFNKLDLDIRSKL